MSSPSLAHQFEILGRKQLALGEGIQMLEAARLDLLRTSKTANALSVTVAFANAALVPLNIVVNAVSPKAANTLYQSAVKALYNYFAASGTRVDGSWKTALKLLKKSLLETLTHSGLKQYIPAVNILVGMSEDSVALFQSVVVHEAGQQERAALLDHLDTKLKAFGAELRRLGIRMAEIQERFARTANVA